jgi:hypothetical protein
MNAWDRLRARAERIKKQYPAGTRVRLISMDDRQAPPIGSLGTVVGVDDIGTVLMQWDNGCTLGVTDADEIEKI